MKAYAISYRSHNPFDEGHWASCLRENFTSSSYGEGLETGRCQAPRQSFTLQQIFRSMKSVLSTRPIYHKCDETIRGHVFCSFLSLLLIKDLQERMEQRGWGEVEWADLIEDLEEVKEIRIETGNKEVLIRSKMGGSSGKAFQAAGVAVPPTVRITKRDGDGAVIPL